MVMTAMVAVMTMMRDDGPAEGGGQGESMGKMEEGKNIFIVSGESEEPRGGERHVQRLFRDSLDGLLRASPPPPRATSGAGPRPTYLGGTASHVSVVLGAPIPRTSTYFIYLFNCVFI